MFIIYKLFYLRRKKIMNFPWRILYSLEFYFLCIGLLFILNQGGLIREKILNCIKTD